MRRLTIFSLAVLLGGLLMAGCSGNPNVEGAKLDLRNNQFDKALANIETALEDNPDNAQAYKVKGDIYRQQASAVQNNAERHSELLQQMLEAYQQALELDSGLQGQIGDIMTRSYAREYNKGGQAFKRGNEDSTAYNEAALYFQNATRIRPDSASPYVNRAYALINAGEVETAIEPLRQGIEKGEDSPDNYIYLADIYRRQGRYEEAIPLLEQAQEQYPGNSDIRSQLLNAFVQTGQMEQAMQRYKEAVEQNPNNAQYQYNYGALLSRNDRYEEAIPYLEKATELQSDYTDAYYNLGAAHVNLAVSTNEKLVQLRDSLEANRSALSESEVQEIENQMRSLNEQVKGRFQSAIPPLQQARKLTEQAGEEATDVCSSLYTAYVQTGQEEEAQAISECAGYDEDMSGAGQESSGGTSP